MDRFPLSYFKNMWSPKQISEKKQTLNWFQLLFILLFLNAVMIVPVSLNYAKMDSFSAANTFPKTFEMIDQTTVNSMSEAAFQLGEMSLDEEFRISSENGVIMGGITNQEAEKILQEEGSALLFLENELLIRETDKPVSRVPYTEDFQLTNVTTIGQFKESISQQWFVKNQSFVVGVFSGVLFVLLLTEFSLLVFGAAFFLFIASKNKQTSQHRFKKALTVVLYSAGVPTFAAMMIGMIEFNIITMITIQSIGMVGYIWVIYYHSKMKELKEQKAQKALTTQIQ